MVYVATFAADQQDMYLVVCVLRYVLVRVRDCVRVGGTDGISHIHARP